MTTSPEEPKQEYSSDSPALVGRAADALAGALPLDPVAAPGGAGQDGEDAPGGAGGLGQRVALRASDAEVRRWRAEAEAAGLGLSDWLRARLGEPGVSVSVTGRPTPVRPLARPPKGLAVDPAAVAAVVRVGTNLNQLARWANTERSLPALVLLQGVAAEVRSTLAALRAADVEVVDQGEGGERR